MRHPRPLKEKARLRVVDGRERKAAGLRVAPGCGRGTGWCTCMGRSLIHVRVSTVNASFSGSGKSFAVVGTARPRRGHIGMRIRGDPRRGEEVHHRRLHAGIGPLQRRRRAARWTEGWPRRAPLKATTDCVCRPVPSPGRATPGGRACSESRQSRSWAEVHRPARRRLPCAELFAGAARSAWQHTSGSPRRRGSVVALAPGPLPPTRRSAAAFQRQPRGNDERLALPDVEPADLAPGQDAGKEGVLVQEAAAPLGEFSQVRARRRGHEESLSPRIHVIPDGGAAEVDVEVRVRVPRRHQAVVLHPGVQRGEATLRIVRRSLGQVRSFRAIAPTAAPPHVLLDALFVGAAVPVPSRGPSLPCSSSGGGTCAGCSGLPSRRCPSPRRCRIHICITSPSSGSCWDVGCHALSAAPAEPVGSSEGFASAELLADPLEHLRPCVVDPVHLANERGRQDIARKLRAAHFQGHQVQELLLDVRLVGMAPGPLAHQPSLRLRSVAGLRLHNLPAEVLRPLAKRHGHLRLIPDFQGRHDGVASQRARDAVHRAIAWHAHANSLPQPGGEHHWLGKPLISNALRVERTGLQVRHAQETRLGGQPVFRRAPQQQLAKGRGVFLRRAEATPSHSRRLPRRHPW
eukprot:scaffold1572_cov272-Pinguiococcus_pyrenoidosus.AAC.7